MFSTISLFVTFFGSCLTMPELTSAPKVDGIFILGRNETSKKMVIVKNDHTMLYCNISGYPEPTVTWFKNGKVLTSQKDAVKPSQKAKLSRQWWIYRASSTDDGNYTCAATNAFGSDSRWSLIEVGQKPTVMILTPQRTYLEGDNATVVCNASGHPPLTVEWFSSKLGQVKIVDLISQDKGRIYSVVTCSSQASCQSELHVTNIVYTDLDTFVCQARSHFATARGEFKVQIKFPPKRLSEDSVAVVYWWDGNLPALRCTVQSHERAQLTWHTPISHRDGIKMVCQEKTGFQETILTSHCLVTLDDREDLGINISQISGDYLCYAENSLGKILVQQYHVQQAYLPLAVEFEVIGFGDDDVTLSYHVLQQDNNPPASLLHIKSKDIQYKKEYNLMQDVSTHKHGMVTLPGVKKGLEYNVSMSALNLAGSGPWTHKLIFYGMSVASTSSSSVQTSATTPTSRPARERLNVFTSASAFNLSVTNMGVTESGKENRKVTIGVNTKVNTAVTWPQSAFNLMNMLPFLLLITL
ncbi:hemicentin-2-like [Physella acuta]|uniref:hemicentin-2-like n=1 Tax=Physella acuta TaxID=109671 RepID=UPI0027DB6E46|nr:hemicentin-2-like [Physella acuta]XP_059158088.1 hemicentin-2-like [Physella acuta]